MERIFISNHVFPLSLIIISRWHCLWKIFNFSIDWYLRILIALRHFWSLYQHLAFLCLLFSVYIHPRKVNQMNYQLWWVWVEVSLCENMSVLWVWGARAMPLCLFLYRVHRLCFASKARGEGLTFHFFCAVKLTQPCKAAILR